MTQGPSRASVEIQPKSAKLAVQPADGQAAVAHDAAVRKGMVPAALWAMSSYELRQAWSERIMPASQRSGGQRPAAGSECSITAVQLAQFLQMHGLRVEVPLATMLLARHGRLEWPEQAVALQRLLRACWEAMEAGSSSEAGGRDVLSRQQVEAVLSKLAGSEAARASMESSEMQEGGGFDFRRLVELAAAVAKHVPVVV
jgi:hypothetical protein